MTFYVHQLLPGPRFAKVIEGDFDRASAAYAALIDYVTERDGVIVGDDEDTDNPGCRDVMVLYNGGTLEQYSVDDRRLT